MTSVKKTIKWVREEENILPQFMTVSHVMKHIEKREEKKLAPFWKVHSNDDDEEVMMTAYSRSPVDSKAQIIKSAQQKEHESKKRKNVFMQS